MYRVFHNGEKADFDGRDPVTGVLQETKGLGYDKHFDAKLEPKKYFLGVKKLINQARRQSRVANGVPIRWHVVEPRMVHIRDMSIPESYYAGVYWPGRKESAEECARRAEVFFHLLARSDLLYARWFEQANSLKKALQLQFEPSYEAFLRFFRSKKYQDGPAGFSFNAWTGHKEDGHGGMVMLSCGSGFDCPPNSCLLYLPSEEPDMGRVLTASVLTDVMRALVLAWEPDWGGVISSAYRESRSEPVGLPYTGWLMYFSRRWGEVPPLPAPVRTEPVEDKGTLILLTPERFTVDDPAHVALADQVRAVLDHAGVVEGVQLLRIDVRELTGEKAAAQKPRVCGIPSFWRCKSSTRCSTTPRLAPRPPPWLLWSCAAPWRTPPRPRSAPLARATLLVYPPSLLTVGVRWHTPNRPARMR